MLAELIIVLVLSSIVITALLAAMIAFVRGLQPPKVTLRGEVLPIAPTFGSFPSAVRVHQALTDRIATARAVYVFGGKHVSIPADAAPTRVRPLATQALPAISDFSAGLPLDAKTFYELYASSLGEQDTTASADDFSILVIGARNGSLAVTCFAQVRRTATTVSDGSETAAFTIREVKLWDADAGVSRYAFAEKPSQTSGIFVGAVHTWLRYRSGAVAEEGPACVIFPDPWLYGGARGRSDDLPPFSRFAYLVSISP